MIKLAAIQLAVSSDVERNLARVGQYLEAAAQGGARIACLPELCCTPWFSWEAGAPVSGAEAVDGPLAHEVAAMASRVGIAVIFPFCEAAGDGVFHNSALVVDSAGRRVGLYRKIHVPLIPRWEERLCFSPGDLGFPVFELEGVRIGVQLGWDNFFPEGFRCLALGGAQVAFVPSAAAFASQERWLAMAVSHAVANGMYVVRVNRVGSEGGLDFYGDSFGVRPDGDLTARPIGRGEGILLLECAPDEVSAARKTWPFLRDRRPRQYARVAGIDWGPGLLPAGPLENPAPERSEEELT